MKIYLIRHGQTTGDIEGRYGGDYDDSLTDEGQDQSLALAKKLVGQGIEMIFFSLKLRALETAYIIKDYLNIPFKMIEGLRERNHYGVLTGLTEEEAKKTRPDLVELLNDNKNTIESGESYSDFSQRIKTVWETLLKTNHEVIGVITHGGVIRFIFSEILQMGEIEINDCAYAELEYNDGKVLVSNLKGISLK